MDLITDYLTIAFSGLNIIALVGLCLLYARIVKRSRAIYPMGLLIFASLLLFQNFFTVFSCLVNSPIFQESVVPYLFVISILQSAGLIALLRVTL